MKVSVEDGLYQARAGNLEKLVFEDDGTKKIRVTQEGFDSIRFVQREMRTLLGGHKPDINLVAEAMIFAAASDSEILEKVRLHALHVFSRSNS